MMSVFRIGTAFAFALATMTFAATASANVQVYPLAAHGFMPSSVVKAADGSIWFTAAELSKCYGNVTCQAEELGTVGSRGVVERGLGVSSIDETYGIVSGPGNTLWLTDALKAIYVFDMSGRQIKKIDLHEAALSPPFAGPDGRMWFAGAGDEGARGFVAIDSTYHKSLVAKCSQCFVTGGVVAGDGNAWFLDPYLGGFYRVTTQGQVKRFDYGKFTLQTMIAGPNSTLWGTANGSIVEYDLMGNVLATFAPQVLVQGGLSLIGGNFEWASFGPTKRGGNELKIATMTLTGNVTVRRFDGLGPCTSQDKQWFSSGPTLGGDGATYVGIGCSHEYAPYTVRGRAAIVRIAP